MATWIFYCLIIVYIFSSLIKKNKKISSDRKKDICEGVHKTVTLECKLRPRKQWLYECFKSTSFYMILFHMFDTFYLSSFFSNYYFNKLCLQLPQNVMSIDEWCKRLARVQGVILAHRISKVSMATCHFIVFFFSKQRFVGNSQGSFKKIHR